MNKVTTINLNGNAYQFEELGYEKLQKYLAEAKVKLAENPDKDEIISDLEQAIADKCNKILNPHKTVVLASEVDQILKEMGPIEGGDGAKDTDNSDKNSAQEKTSSHENGAPKRLYRIREGEVLAGVCTGLAAYFDADVTIVRIIFILLVLLTHGFGALAYFVMMMVVPYAGTYEEKAAAHGERFNAQELINRTRQSFNDIKTNLHKFHDAHKNAQDEHKKMTKDEHKQSRREWKRQQKEARRQAKRQARYSYNYNYNYNGVTGYPPSYAQRPSYATETIFGLLKAAIALFWALGLVSIITKGSILGYVIPVGLPLWVAIVLWVCFYSFISWPFKAHRFGGTDNYYASGWNGILEAVAWIGVMAVFVWLAYQYIPAAHTALNELWLKLPPSWHIWQ